MADESWYSKVASLLGIDPTLMMKSFCKPKIKVWLVHVNINLWCLLVTFPLFIFGESLDQLAQSGWQKGRILTAVHAYIYIYYDIDLEIYFNIHFDIMTHFKVGTEWVTKGQNIDQSYQSVAGIARGLYGRSYKTILTLPRKFSIFGFCIEKGAELQNVIFLHRMPTNCDKFGTKNKTGLRGKNHPINQLIKLKKNSAVSHTFYPQTSTFLYGYICYIRDILQLWEVVTLSIYYFLINF